MSTVQEVSTKNEYKRHYIKPLPLAGAVTLGASYGLTRGKNMDLDVLRSWYPIHDRLETFLSKNKLGDKFVKFIRKGEVASPVRPKLDLKTLVEKAGKTAEDAVEEAVEKVATDLTIIKTEKTAKKAFEIKNSMIKIGKNHNLDKFTAIKGAGVAAVLYVGVKMIKKGLDALDRKLYRSK